MDFSSYFDYPGTGDETTEKLSEPFLHEFDESDWAALRPFTVTLVFSKGEQVITHLDKDRSLYIVTKGSFSVTVPTEGAGPNQVVATLHPGSFFGELSFLDGGPRSADVVAASSGEIIKLTRHLFDELIGNEPSIATRFLLDLGRILSLRLRKSTASKSSSKTL